MKPNSKYAFLILFIGILLCSCKEEPEVIEIKLCPDAIVEEGTVSNIQEYQIIDAVVNDQFSRNDVVHILQETSTALILGDPSETLEYLQQSGADLELDHIIDYQALNMVQEKWNASFENAKLLGGEELDCFQEVTASTCDRYKKKYPNGTGFIKFSRPAVNGNSAIVEYFKNICGNGIGVFVVLERIDDQWQVKNSFPTIIT